MSEPSRLAVWLDSYRADLRSAVESAAGQGFQLLQANAAGEQLDPKNFAPSAQRHFARYLAGLGVRLDALAVEYPGGLADPRHADERFDRLAQTLRFCSELGIRRAVTTISGFDESGRSDLAADLLTTAADLADRHGIVLSVRSPTDPLLVVRKQLDRLSCPSLALSVDTAESPASAESLSLLAGRVGDAQIRDARRSGSTVEETRFGEGEVDLRGWLALLTKSEYRGPLVIRRNSATGIDALRQGREYVQSLL